LMAHAALVALVRTAQRSSFSRMIRRTSKVKKSEEQLEKTVEALEQEKAEMEEELVELKTEALKGWKKCFGSCAMPKEVKEKLAELQLKLKESAEKIEKLKANKLYYSPNAVPFSPAVTFTPPFNNEPSSSKPRLFAFDASSDPPCKTRRRVHAIPINSSQPTEIESEIFEGRAMVLHAGDLASPHEQYFANKTRRWEIRFQGRFKVLPKGKIFVGAVPEDDFMGEQPSRSLRITARVAEAVLRSLVPDAYFTLGDRGASSRSADAELPHAVAGLRGFDQIIVTPVGTTPPRLEENLASYGGLRAQMHQADWLEHADAPLRTDVTYTFGMWGVSRHVNLVEWQYEMAGGLGGLTSAMVPEYPQHIVAYALDGDSLLHRESRKIYIIDLLLFSSKALPLHQSVMDRYGFSGHT